MYRLVIIAMIILTFPAFAQDPCGDLDCNGYCIEISDFVLALRIIGDRCTIDSIQQCTIYEGDVDEDGYSVTIADAMTMFFIIIDVPLPDFSRHPESDTIKVGSAIASPGETVELPIYIKTIDTVTAFQISIETDPDIITIDTLVFLDDSVSIYSYCSGHAYACCFNEGIFYADSVTLLPGEYHIADLFVTVNPEIDEPVTTQISFSNVPELLQYTAFSNGAFFTPVAADGEIQIITTGIENGEHDNIPGKLSLNAYPNPFNSSTTIEFDLPEAMYVRVDIFDILGRRVETPVDEWLKAGSYRVVWDASHYSSGMYFYRIEARDYVEIRKMVYLK